MPTCHVKNSLLKLDDQPGELVTNIFIHPVAKLGSELFNGDFQNLLPFVMIGRSIIMKQPKLFVWVNAQHHKGLDTIFIQIYMDASTGVSGVGAHPYRMYQGFSVCF